MPTILIQSGVSSEVEWSDQEAHIPGCRKINPGCHHIQLFFLGVSVLVIQQPGYQFHARWIILILTAAVNGDQFLRGEFIQPAAQ